MFSNEFSDVLEHAYREASERKHAFFCVEHLLYALLDNREVREIIEATGGDLEHLREKLQQFFEDHIEQLPEISEKLEENTEIDFQEITPMQTTAVQNVLHRAILQVRSSGKSIVSPREVLVQIFDEPDCHAAYYLKQEGIKKLDVISYVSHGVSKIPLLNNEDRQLIVPQDEESIDQGEKSGYLKNFTRNLTAEAKEGDLDPVFGRELELENVIRILCRRQKNNPILIGEPGVGKTAMANALSAAIISKDVPDHLANSEVFLMEVSSVIAGTRFRGEFEARVKGIINELLQKERPVLFIDEIHTIVGAGATGTGTLDFANLIKPILSNGKILIIGSTTHDEYKKVFEKDRALSRRFSKVVIAEPSIAKTVEILKGLKKYFEDYHHVKYHDDALEVASKLSQKHINDRFLPDKAIDLIDEAGANNTLLKKNRKKLITASHIEQLVAKITGIPVQTLSAKDKKDLKNLEANIQKKVFGQDQAVQAVCTAIKRSRAKLQDDRKPLGSFLFAGPTGVGKTELARALAEELSVPFQRFDMSEYMEKHAVSRLVGAPPGYVGYEEGGLLTDLVRKQPYAVILLDELEKAHADVYNILLQIMDDATLTDAQGRKADFRNTVIIMTSNAGSTAGKSLGFGNLASNHQKDSAIKRIFRPEFRNRLDEIVYFNTLSKKVVNLIVKKFIDELAAQLEESKVNISFDQQAKDYLAENGFSETMGARPMRRLIQKEVKDQIANEILFGDLSNGGEVQVSCHDHQLTFQFKAAK